MELKNRSRRLKSLAGRVRADTVCAMKALLILLCSFSAGLIMKSETLSMVRVVLAEPGPTGSTKNAASTKKADAKAPDAAKVEGVEIARSGGGFMGVAMVGSTFKITFYDAKRKAIAADVPRALLRWNPKNQSGSERVVLTRTEDGKALASPRNIRPPYLFKLYVTLLKSSVEGEGEDAAGETYVVDFRA
jgi:hypothetical protein